MKQRCVALKIVVVSYNITLRETKALFTLFRIAFSLRRKSYWIGLLLFKNKNGRKWSVTHRIDFVPYFGAV